MQQESLYGRLYNKDKTSKSSENVNFSAKCNKEISIHMVKQTFGSKYEEKCLVKEVKLGCQAMLQEAVSQVEMTYRLLITKP